MADSDEWLISRAVAHQDTQAFDKLVQRYQSRIRGWLRHLAKDAELADDLAQETFFRAWRKLGSYQSKGSFEAWLLTIARNEFLQGIRKAGRESAKIDRLETETKALNRSSHAANFHGEDSDASRFMAILGADERDVMILVYGIGLSHSEASVVSGLPLGTVKSHVRRSVAKIRKHFGLLEFNHE